MANKLLFSVRDILAEIYSDEVDSIIKKLDEYRLTEIVDNKLEYLKSKTELNTRIDIDLNTFTVSFIKSINDVILNIKEINDRVYLKYVLGDIGRYIIAFLISNEIIGEFELVGIQTALKNTAEIENYNYGDIERLLQFGKTINKKSSIATSGREKNEKTVYYEWLAKESLLDEIAGNLKCEGLISPVKCFKKLFSNQPKKVVFKAEYKEFILILFDALQKEGCIKPKGNKGHFVPLKRYAVDLENNFLFEKEMKTIKNTIKKNDSKYLKLKEKAENWIN